MSNFITENGTFVGTDGSMGLTRGESYKCTVKLIDGTIYVQIGYWFSCPYSTLSAFQKNWDFRKK